jgi:large subunit ribosomal protein L24
MARHVRKGDSVMITSGAHKGKMGKIKEVITKDDRVIVEGLNLKTRHMKPTRTNPQGAIVSVEAPMHISKVSPVVDGKPTRVRFITKPDGAKVRVAVRGGAELGVVRSAAAAGKSGAKKK